MKKLLVVGMFIGGFVLGGNLIAAETTTTTVTTTPAQPQTVTVLPAQPASTATVTYTQPATVTTTPVQTETKTVTVTTEKKPEQQYHSLSNPFLCWIINVGICWVEIPRCVVYDNAAIPFFGLIIGIPDGAFFTVTRVLVGVGDIITLGFIGDVYTKRYPDFVWESNWLPPKADKE